jgi:hypothetical protein
VKTKSQRVEKRRAGSSPASGTSFNLLMFNKMGRPEEASASESASEISTRAKLNHYPGTTRPPLATTGFAARLV